MTTEKSSLGIGKKRSIRQATMMNRELNLIRIEISFEVIGYLLDAGKFLDSNLFVL